jgi:hypothetical protein
MRRHVASAAMAALLTGVWFSPWHWPGLLQWSIILDLGLLARYAPRQDARAVMKPTRDRQ